MRVLIFKVNQLGDNVVFLPVVQEMRRRFPHWELAVFTGPTAAPLYQADIAPERLFALPTPKFNGSWKRPLDFIRLWRKVAAFAPDACLIADDQANVAYLLSFLSASPVRVAVKRSFIKVGLLTTRRLPGIPGEKVAMVNWRIARALVQGLGERDWPESPPAPDLSHLAAGAAPLSGLPRIVIHDGASRAYQRWFPERYVELANRFQAEGRWQVVWIDTPGATAAGLSPGVQREQTPTLADLARTLRGAALFIGNNSGPMHVANALGCRSVIMNGPTTYDWDPLWHRDRMLMLRDESLDCLPCDGLVPRLDFCRNEASPMACMKFWSVDSIHRRCVDWIDRPALEAPAPAIEKKPKAPWVNVSTQARPEPGLAERIKLALRPMVVRLARRLGSDIVDARTGEVLGRALLIPFRGKIHVIGLETPVVPAFISQVRLTYWKQELGFTSHPPPDFPHETRP